MTEKLVIQFGPLPVYEARVDYLRYCLNCNTYHINNEKPCIKCGKAENSVSLETIAKKTVRRQFINRIGINLLIYALLFVLSMSFKAIIFSTLFSIICIGLNLLIYIKAKTSFCARELQKHLLANRSKIKEDLLMQLEQSKVKIAKGEYIESYNELRYLAQLIDLQEIRVYKLICLSHYRLRKDLPLEMKTLLLNDCNMILIRYIGEIAKIKKELIDEATIKYILMYKKQVLTEPKGREIIGAVLGATLRSKYLLNKYAVELKEYINVLPRERLLRICKIQEGIQDVALRAELIEQVKAIAYHDKAFSSYF